jgi:hypothetical protein
MTECWLDRLEWRASLEEGGRPGRKAQTRSARVMALGVLRREREIEGLLDEISGDSR